MAENEALRALYAQLAKALGGPHWRGALQLLAARLLSAQYYPQRYQLRLADYEETGAFAEPTAATVWDMVAAGQTQRAAEALRQACAAYPGLAAALGDAQEWDAGALAAQLSYLMRPGDDAAAVLDDFLAFCAGRETRDDFRTPADVAALMAALAVPAGASVYDPHCACGALLAAGRRAGGGALYAQPRSDEAQGLAALELALAGAPVHLAPAGAALVQDGWHGCAFDAVLLNPPFNQTGWSGAKSAKDESAARWPYGPPPRSNANFAWLQYALRHLRENGRAAVLLPNGALTSQVQRERAIRAALVQAGAVRAVIALPGGLFYNSRVPCSLWLLQRGAPLADLLLLDACAMAHKTAGHGRKTRALGEDAREKLCALVRSFESGALSGKSAEYAVVPLAQAAADECLLSPNLYTDAPVRGQRAPHAEWEGLTRELAALLEEDAALNKRLKRQLEAMGFGR